MNHCVRRCAAVGLIAALLFPSLVWAQPEISAVGFEQINWYGYDGKDEVLVEANSSWGRFQFDRDPDDTLWYLNLSAALSEGGEPHWVVENFPLLPDSVCDGLCSQIIDIDLTQLGLPPGENWAEVYYDISVTAEPADHGPATLTKSATVSDRDRHPTNPPIVGDSNIPIKQKPPAGHKPGGGKGGKVTDISPPRGMPGVQEDDQHCFAGATARSISWLDEKYGFGIGKSAQEIYDDLVERGVSKRNEKGEGDEAGWIDAKAKYLDDAGGVTKVWDASRHIKKKLNVAVKTDSDFFDWLLDELITEEDIEIAFTNGSSSHIVTVERVYRQNGKLYVEYRDDEDQGKPGEGDKAPKVAQIYPGGDGKPRFGGDGNVIHFALSESPKRTPAADGSTVTWVAPGGGGGGGKGSNSGREPVRVKTKAGGSISFFWTSDGKPHPGYGTFSASTDKGELTFTPPRDRTVTDWKATVTSGKGSNSTSGGNIRRNSPWAFHSLQTLPPNPIRIPALAPTEDAFELTIYAAVNLELYMTANPDGPLNGLWEVGQTLDELGLEIVDGRIPGIEGLYFATVEFVMDPDSATGWVPGSGESGWLDSGPFQGEHGPIVIVSAFDNFRGPPPVFGDLNCDGGVDFNDIDPFVTALISRTDYESQFPDCNWLHGDINRDGAVDFNDIDGFVECIIMGGCA